MLLIHNNLLILLDEEKPIVDEDIEVKRMKRLEQLKARRAYHDISEDGSGWVPLSNNDIHLHPVNRGFEMTLLHQNLK